MSNKSKLKTVLMDKFAFTMPVLSDKQKALALVGGGALVGGAIGGATKSKDPEKAESKVNKLKRILVGATIGAGMGGAGLAGYIALNRPTNTPTKALPPGASALEPYIKKPTIGSDKAKSKAKPQQDTTIAADEASRKLSFYDVVLPKYQVDDGGK